MRIYLFDKKWHSNPPKCNAYFSAATPQLKIGGCRSCGCQPDPPKEDFCPICFPTINKNEN